MILFLLLGGINYCSLLFPDDPLRMERVDYIGNELRVDGYYYLHQEDGTHVLFLYRNGTMIMTRHYWSLDLTVVEAEVMKEIDEFQKRKSNWGVFMIKGNKIEYENWIYPYERYKIMEGSGNIENNTSFRITEKYYPYNLRTEHVNEVWHFKQFSPKPDSTNNFIR